MDGTGFLEKFEEVKPYLEEAVSRDYVQFRNSEVSLLKFSENIICLLQSAGDGTKAVLRLNRPGYHDETELENELKWIMEIQEETDIQTAQVYQGDDGQIMHTFLSGRNILYTYSIQEFLTGVPLRKLVGTDLCAQMENAGCIAAKLHAMEERKRHQASSFKRFTWDVADTLRQGGRWGFYLDYPGLHSEESRLLQRAGEQIEKSLEAYGRKPANYGLIHADLHLENLLVDNGRIALIDFDDCGYSWYLYDLASAVSQQSHNVKTLTDAFLTGYRTVRQLTEEDLAQVDTFVLMRRLVRLGWLASHQDNGVLAREGMEYKEATLAMARAYLENC